MTQQVFKYAMYDTVRVIDVDRLMHGQCGVVIEQSHLLINDKLVNSYKVRFDDDSWAWRFNEWHLAPNPPLDKLSASIRAMWNDVKAPNYKPKSFRETVREKVIDRLVATGCVTRTQPASEPVTPENPKRSAMSDGVALCEAYGIDWTHLHSIEVKANVGELTEITTRQHVTKVVDKTELLEVITHQYHVYPR